MLYMLDFVASCTCRSVFYLPRPRPISHLVGDLWGGRTLVLQGALDPLNDAKGALFDRLLSSTISCQLKNDWHFGERCECIKIVIQPAHRAAAPRLLTPRLRQRCGNDA